MINKKFRELLSIFRESLRKLYFPVLIIPVLVAIISFLAIARQMPLETYKSWYAAVKPFWEYWALILLKVALAIAILRVFFTKFAPFSIWLTGVVTVFLMREIHWDFMSTGVYVGVFALLLIAWLKYEVLKEYMRQRFFINIFTMIFLTYFIAVTFDGQWWTESNRMDKVGQLAEEILEVFGHLLVLVMVIFYRKKRHGEAKKSSADGMAANP